LGIETSFPDPLMVPASPQAFVSVRSEIVTWMTGPRNVRRQ
jgi:hypothetical protein